MARTCTSPFLLAALLGLLIAGPLAAGRHVVAAAEARAGGPILLINEVLYDAAGPDEGEEFVELLLTGIEPLDLGRVTLERGNGSRPGDWRESWHGASGESLRPGAHFVVGGAGVEPHPHAVVELGLQNGPDACRVLVDGIVVDVLGWGALEGREFFAGEPAPDVAPGTSLGRVPDGRATASNRADFAALPTPSPGAPNRRPPPLRLRSPGHRSDAGEERLDLVVDWRLEREDDVASPTLALVEVSAFPCLAPAIRAAERVLLGGGDAWGGVLTLAGLDPGPLDLCLSWRPVDPPEVDGLLPDTLRVAARAGPGPLRVNEFLYRPLPGGSEWIELVNAGQDTLPTESFALADGRLEPELLAGAPPLAPGELLVVSEEALPGVLPAVVLGSRWPALNDSGEPVADRIRVVDGAGRTSDDLAYGGGWAPAGASVERISFDMASADPAAWSASPAGPTPGRRNGAAREFPPGSGFLRVEPARITRGARAPLILWLAEPVRDGALTIHALDGRIVRRFGPVELSGRRFLIWDGRDETGELLAAGLYLLTLAGEPVARRHRPPRAIEGRATLAVAP